MSAAESLRRANSHWRYWLYRRRIGSPVSTPDTLRQWWARFWFERKQRSHPMNDAQQCIAVSLSLQSLAKIVSDYLAEQANEPIAFVLIVSVEKTAQYVSNASRADGIEMIESLLARWKAKRADIPAHYNPDLKAVRQPLTQCGWIDEFGNVYPMGTWVPTKRTWHDGYKEPWQPVYRATDAGIKGAPK